MRFGTSTTRRLAVITHWTGSGAFVRINDTELEWLGYKRGQVIGKMKIGDVLTPESRRAFQKTLAGFRKRGRMRGLEVEFVRSDGTTFPALLNATAIRDADGKFVMTRSTVFDITDRQKAENELRESERRARSIISTSHDAFVAIDESGAIADWNLQAENTFGWSRKEALGRTALGDHHPQTPARSSFPWPETVPFYRQGSDAQSTHRALGRPSGRPRISGRAHDLARPNGRSVRLQRLRSRHH